MVNSEEPKTENNKQKRKRELLFMDDCDADSSTSASASSSSEDTNDDFDLFAETPKQDWSEHPRYRALLSSGMGMIAQVGFRSPKANQKSKQTVEPLAKSVGIRNLPARAKAEALVVRAMAIKRIQKLDETACNLYTDLNCSESSS